METGLDHGDSGFDGMLNGTAGELDRMYTRARLPSYADLDQWSNDLRKDRRLLGGFCCFGRNVLRPLAHQEIDRIADDVQAVKVE